MKKFSLVILWIFTIAAPACRKQYTCHYSYYYLPLKVSFVGYAEAELDILILNSYEQNSNYVRLI